MLKQRTCVLAWILACWIFGAPSWAQRLKFIASPAEAKIYLVGNGQEREFLGDGKVSYKLSRDHNNTILVEADGYVSKSWSFPKGRRYREKSISLQLVDRIINVSALPFDAEILVDGRPVGNRNAEVLVPRGEAVTVQVKKSGFRTLERLYRNQGGEAEPPVSEELHLIQRIVALSALPNGAMISADGLAVGTSYSEIEIDAGDCVTVQVSKEPFAPIEKVYCHKEGAPVAPESDEVVLQDWQVTVRGPESAEVRVEELGAISVGEYSLIVPQGTCRNIEVSLTGYISSRTRLCNQPGQVVPPKVQQVALRPDEAFTKSEQTDQANVDFVVEAHEDKTYQEAWRLLSQIILDAFDVLEITDRETGYLRTAWEVARFEGSTVRTRVIVKQRDYKPIKFAVKIVSEHARSSSVSAKEDEAFAEWDYLMYEYKDILTELVHRLGSSSGL